MEDENCENFDLGGVSWELANLEWECQPCLQFENNRFNAFMDDAKDGEGDDDDDDSSQEDDWEVQKNVKKKQKIKMKRIAKNQWKQVELEINAVESDKKNLKRVRGMVTVDSGAEENVWPMAMDVDGETLDNTRKGDFVAANGAKMPNLGQKRVPMKLQMHGGKEVDAAMSFHLTDVRKPLAAVSKMVDKGNYVCFGPNACDNFVQNVKTGEKVPMMRERGTYVIDVAYMVNQVGSEGPEGFTRQGA